jgi:hypothetical protein
LATILVKNVPEGLLKELKRLKAELDCTWAELLAHIVEGNRIITLNEKKLNEIRSGVRGFLALRSTVSERWVGQPGVLEEARRSRNHANP